MFFRPKPREIRPRPTQTPAQPADPTAQAHSGDPKAQPDPSANPVPDPLKTRRHQTRARHVALTHWTASARVSADARRWRQPASAGHDLPLTRHTRAWCTRAYQNSEVQLTRASCDWDSSVFDQNQPKKPPIRGWHVALRYLTLGNCIFTPLTLLNCILALFPTL